MISEGYVHRFYILQLRNMFYLERIKFKKNLWTDPKHHKSIVAATGTEQIKKTLKATRMPELETVPWIPRVKIGELSL